MPHQYYEVLFALVVVGIACFAPYQFPLARAGIGLIGAAGVVDGVGGPASRIPLPQTFFVGTVLVGLAAVWETIRWWRAKRAS
jgi:hypothetical protein